MREWWLRRGTAGRASALVEESREFRANERRQDPGAQRYTLRDTGEAVFLRHDGSHAFALEECLGPEPAYEPPPEAAAVLTGEPVRAVIDVGAHIGMFGLYALRRFPSCRVLGFEPDPADAELHEACIEANGLGSRWRLRRAFAAAKTRTVKFVAGRGGLSHVASPDEYDIALDVQALDVFPYLKPADLIKIDIEGAEWELLADPRMDEIEARAMVIEVHGRGSPGDDPVGSAGELLAKADFEIASVVPKKPAEPHLDWARVWACRR